MAVLRILSIAVASGRVGYTYLIGGRLKDWRVSDKAAKSEKHAARETQKWIDELKPDAVVTEKPEEAAKKGEKTKGIIAAIARVAERNHLLDVQVKRQHDYQDKYEEAAAIAERYPDIKAWVPKKRRFFDNEPRNTVLFEALSLAEAVIYGDGLTLAVAMG